MSSAQADPSTEPPAPVGLGSSASSLAEPVRPALNFARPSDSMLDMPPPHKLRPNAPLYKRLFHIHHWPRSLRVGLTCSCIVANSVSGNGVYAWPQYGPFIIKRMGLSATEGQTIVVAGICGIYLMAAPLGDLCDRKGPRFSCFVSAGLALLGYLGFAFLLDRLDPETPYLPLYLSLCFFLVGSATIGSYFAALTTATLSFPAYPTLALSVPLSAFGLSSFVISSLGRLPFLSQWVVHRGGIVERELMPTAFLRFLGVTVALVNIFSAVFMNVIPSKETAAMGGEQGDFSPSISDDEDREELLEGEHVEGEADLSMSVASLAKSYRSGRSIRSSAVDYPDAPQHLLNTSERTPLLIGGPRALYAAAAEEEAHAVAKAASTRAAGGTSANGDTTAEIITYDEEAMLEACHVHWTARKLVADWGFWAFGAVIVLAIGPAEMTLSSIGSIVTYLVLAEDPEAGFTATDLVSALSPFSITPLMAIAPSEPKTLDLLGLRSKHILYLSLSSTLARLVTGVIADYLNPLTVPDIAGVHRRRTVKRSMLATGAMGVATAVYVFAASGINNESRLWVLTIGIGSMYGTIFTLTPAITSKQYGPAHFGLTWGMLSYFCAIGAFIFSFLFSAVSEHAAKQQAKAEGSRFAKKPNTQQCRGSSCFETTYAVSAVSCFLAMLGLFLLSRRWKV